jgi:hypothetical protein
MPKYKYLLSNGKNLTLEGDTMPSDEEVESIAKENNVSLQPADIPESTLPIAPINEEPPQDKGLLSKGWETANKSLFEYGPDWLNPSKRIETRIAEEPGVTPEDWNIPFTGGAKWKGLRQGIEQGTGKVLSGLASPINIATTALTAGSGGALKAGLPGIAKALKYGAQGAGLLTAGHGAINVAHPESTLQERLMGLTELAGGMAAARPTKVQIQRGRLNDIGKSIEKQKSITPEILSESASRLKILPDESMISDPNVVNWLDRERAIRIKEGHDPETGLKSEPDVIDTTSVPPRLKEYEPTVESIPKIPVRTYTSGRLEEAGTGKPGLSEHVNESDDIKFVTYRGTDGNPIATAKLIKDSNGTWQIEDFAADKTKGLLYGRAVKSIGQKLKESGNLSQTTHLTDDSLNLIDKAEASQQLSGEEAKTLRGRQKSKLLTDESGVMNVGSKTPKPTYNMGQVVVIKSGKATPGLVKKAMEQGFEYEGINDEGNFRFKKTSEGSKQPILEEEVGLHRPTLGPKTDIKKQSAIAEAMNFPRSVMSSMDFSAPLRQGIGLIHKKQFWTSLDDMFKAWGSEDAYQQIQKSIGEKPLFRPRAGIGGKELPSFAEDAGIKLTELTDLTRREEALMSSWAEKIPGVRRSNRAYTAFLNKLRADTFESLIENGKVFGADGEANLPLAREIANFVNTASGRGSLGKLESSAVALNSMFFSPRLIASRLRMMDPRLYVTGDKFVRKEALKSLFAITAVGNTIGQLGRMSGMGTVERDPTSSDFGKLKIGKVRIDPFAGFQQYIVAANRLIQGRTKSSTTSREYKLGEKFGRPTRLDVVGRFAESKLNPVLSFVTGFLRGKDFTGQPFNVPEEMVQRIIPIMVQDIYELAVENPLLLPLAIPAAFGMGIQTYGR